MTHASLGPDVMLPWAKALITASFGISVIQSMRGNHDLGVAVERLIIGFLALTFFKVGATGLLAVSNELALYVGKLGDPDGLKVLILDAFQKASEIPGPHAGIGPNVPGILEQAWRTGVWGIMTSFTEWAFMLSSFLLETAREVFWNLLLFLFPLACGVYPSFPRILGNLTLYAVELSLWFPMLALVEISTGAVAKTYLTQSGGWGLYIVAVELIAIFLTMAIPMTTHRFLSGALAGDMDSGSGLVRLSVRAAAMVKSFGVSA